MNRDHALVLVVGLLVGFVAGYLVHEVMASSQPPRRYAAAERVLDELRALQPDIPDVQRLADEVAHPRGGA